MKKYGDLNLKKLRELADLDFAHFTYKSNQCSCCSTPRDLPAIYWKNRVVSGSDEDYTYILFKNANNGSGIVTKNDVIKNDTCISYHVRDEKQMDEIITELKNQLDDDYIVEKPNDSLFTIIIYVKSEIQKELKSVKDYIAVLEKHVNGDIVDEDGLLSEMTKGDLQKRIIRYKERQEELQSILNIK